MTIKTSLDHLPEAKQNAIAEIRRVILNEVDAYLENKAGKHYSYIVWLVLFGSYARGNYVDNPVNGYVSDFDILVAVNGRELADDLRLWHSIEDKIDRITRAPVNLIVHTHEEVAQWLKEGHYFFSDIRKEGVYLHTNSGKGLPEPKHLTNEERLPVAEKHYAQWFDLGKDFLDGFEFYFGKNRLKLAAFNLHQATERFYACLLLVLSNYRPRTHNIKNLRHMAVDMTAPDTSLTKIFPGETKFQRRCFELLKRAYIESRYSEHYEIAKDELEWLHGEVEKLRDAISQLCLDHIEQLKTT